MSGLHQSQIAMALEGPGQAFPSELIFTGSQQKVDPEGNPVFDEEGNPVMIGVPGPVAPASLPGFYRQALATGFGLLLSRVAATLYIDTGTHKGLALAAVDLAPQ